MVIYTGKTSREPNFTLVNNPKEWIIVGEYSNLMIHRMPLMYSSEGIISDILLDVVVAVCVLISACYVAHFASKDALTPTYHKSKLVYRSADFITPS